MPPLSPWKVRQTDVWRGAPGVVLLRLVVSAGLLAACEGQGICPDPEVAQGTWLPSGGTRDWVPSSLLAVTETELCLHDYTSNLIRVFDPLSHEQTVSSTLPYDKLSPSGIAATQELLLAVSGSAGRDYLPIAQLWDRTSDTWTQLEMPAYAPPGQNYQVHWTGEVFLMLGAMDVMNQWLGGGAVLDPVSLEWQPLFDEGVDVPEVYGHSIWTNHGLFWWAARQLTGPAEAWLFTPEDGWRAFSMEGAPTSTFYHYPSTDGERVWLYGGYQGSTSVMEVWEVDLARGTWGLPKPPPGAPPGIRVGGTTAVGNWLLVGAPGCEGGAFWMHQPETGEWAVGRPSPARGWGPGWIGVIADHLVTYGEIADGWTSGQMYTFFPDCEPGTVCE